MSMSSTCSFKPCLYPRPAEWLKGRTVGRGSHGSVDLALDKATGGLFVIKSAESESGILCLENEVEILETLDSPHIVKCLGKDISKGNGHKANLFMEYMAGGSLADVMGQFGGRLDETVIRLYTREILLGLEFLHGNGIVHCDLKCKNVLLGSSGEVKLADFGCSQRRTSQRREKDSLRRPIGGSPLWMAPENLIGESESGPDFSSDIWSLGCTVIEMATGQLPWAGEISNNIILKIARGKEKPNFPRHLSEEGLDFLDKCLNRDPKKRWKAGELLQHPFVLEKPKDNSKYASSSSSSPASVLDKSIFPESDCSDDEEDESREARPPFRIPFSMLSDKNTLADQQEEEWITVR